MKNADIEQFGSFWNLLHTINYVYEFEAPYPFGIIYKKKRLHDRFDFVDWFELHGAEQGSDIAGTYSGINIRTIPRQQVPGEPIDETALPTFEVLSDYFSKSNYSIDNLFYAHFEELEDYYLSVPVYYSRIPFDLQKEFSALAGFDWPRQSFKSAFPELAEATTNIASLGMNDLRNVLQDRRDRNGDPLELFGVKLKINEIGRWAIIILLAQELYFFMHLSALVKRVSSQDPIWTYPWIIMYPNVLTRIVGLITTSIIPLIVCSFMWWKSLPPNGFDLTGWIVLAIFIIPMIFLSCGVANQLCRLCRSQ